MFIVFVCLVVFLHLYPPVRGGSSSGACGLDGEFYCTC